MIYKDCIHYEACKDIYYPMSTYDEEAKAFDESDSCDGCQFYSDKSRFIELPCKPKALMKDNNPFNTDVYCPTCGTNIYIYGYYGDEPLSVIQCFYCGELLDNTRAITREEAENL